MGLAVLAPEHYKARRSTKIVIIGKNVPQFGKFSCKKIFRVLNVRVKNFRTQKATTKIKQYEIF